MANAPTDDKGSMSLGTATLDVQPVITSPAITADGQTIAQLVDEAKARELVTITEHRKYALILAEGQTANLLDVDPEEFAPAPFAKRGIVTLTDADSFVTYVHRHSVASETTLWSDIARGRIVAVFDDHAVNADETRGVAGWGRHRAILSLTQTADWQHWTGKDGQYMDQTKFAEHIEDGADAIHEPTPAEMLEVAQTFHAKTGVSFESSRRLSGEVEFSYAETVGAKAGEKGKLEVPQVFTLGMAPFEGNALYPVQARFRFRLANGNLSLGYRLIRADRVLRTAFDDLVKVIADGAGLPVMAGTPRQS